MSLFSNGVVTGEVGRKNKGIRKEGNWTYRSNRGINTLTIFCIYEKSSKNLKSQHMQNTRINKQDYSLSIHRQLSYMK